MMTEGAKVPQIAKACGVSEQSVYKWIKNPQFRANLHEANYAVVNVGITRMSQHFNEAVDVILQSFKSDNENVRLKAALEYVKIVRDKPTLEQENQELREHITRMYDALSKLSPEEKKSVMDAYNHEEEEETIDTVGIWEDDDTRTHPKYEPVPQEPPRPLGTNRYFGHGDDGEED